ncbi:hypothetical protein [Capnocytophaga felis]|uniref:Uncharacterized protein n=1 Tax=Capnocytophaga felis TaxID=2267611 RepID=A0A5M4B7G0_9FLAO|nr:hypothetical protein [Capnocytophaga felis]GET45544.1 hypothetical protein RCZ01_08460 [Capnocytophaga felis]GET47293.1 hypothetical protein RCZ02_01240 [Capnocytophaga felis]
MNKKTQNYLRIYANINKEDYTETEKEALVKTLITIGEDIFEQTDLRMDINGSGYGISKGDPLVKQTTFWKKIDKKGYKNLFGISASHKDDYSYRSQFNLWIQSYNFSRLDIEFFWKANDSFDHEKAKKIIEAYLPIARIDYAYGYLADKNLTWGEWITKESFWSSTSYIPKEEEIWEEQIGEIPNGKMKKMYAFNVLNQKQIENIQKEYKKLDIKVIRLDNELEIWQKNLS